MNHVISTLVNPQRSTRFLDWGFACAFAMSNERWGMVLLLPLISQLAYDGKPARWSSEVWRLINPAKQCASVIYRLFTVSLSAGPTIVKVASESQRRPTQH
jgi:hypothetical protein